MADEKELKEKGRQLKIKGMDGEETMEKGKKKEKREKESKVWVLVIFGVSILISLLFSIKAGSFKEMFKREQVEETMIDPVPTSGGGIDTGRDIQRKGLPWFGEAVYEFGK